jgi:hypothetical protein
MHEDYLPSRKVAWLVSTKREFPPKNFGGFKVRILFHPEPLLGNYLKA